MKNILIVICSFICFLVPASVAVAAAARADSSGATRTDPVTGMQFVFIKGGCFQMGNKLGAPDEKPEHEVCLDDYYMGKYEVTQKQWQQIMGSNPSKIVKGDDYPVEGISREATEEFIGRLNRGSGWKYRLPTEAEWEYAARSGGKRETFAGTSNEGEFGDYAWFRDNSGGKTHPVGMKKPNGLGLHDMTGNVWEWVQDFYAQDYYRKSPRNNPKGPDGDGDPMLRGGSWTDGASNVRTTMRDYDIPGERFYTIGLRLVLPAR